ncbi:MAG: DNA polymerase III subunit delta, partial [Bacteroidetes bacterium SW_10_40_5]
VFEIIHDFDLRARGINDGGNSEPELMKEMVYKIVYL